MAQPAGFTAKNWPNKGPRPHAARGGRLSTLFNLPVEGSRRQWLQLAVLCFVLLPINLYTICHLFPWSSDSALDSQPSRGLHRGEVLPTLQLRIILVISNMVSTIWGGLAARTVFLVSSHFVQRADKAIYSSNTVTAVKTLQGWYNAGQGLWDTAGWWNSANCLTVLADFATLDGIDANTLDIAGIISNTFTNAQKTPMAVQKSMSSTGMIQSTYTVTSTETRSGLATRGFEGFLNDFYDDEGWWALALVRSWDLVHDDRYLDMAQLIFDDMKNGTDDVCGGGIWWSRERAYKNAIANGLYLSLAASLANRVTSNQGYFLDIAKEEWAWFKNSGMINKNNHINDGLTIRADGTCVNNGMNPWSYNQGVVLGGLVELAKATGDPSYLSEAEALAMAAISLLSDANGIIHEAACEPKCGPDASQFKGIFVRNLGYLQRAAPRDAYKVSILKNADSIWATARNPTGGRIGVVWSGPYDVGSGPTAATHSSAMDALVAAIGAA